MALSARSGSSGHHHWGTGGLPVNNVDSTHMVPHYDIHGCQHHRNPYKDKSHLNDVDIRHHRWLQPAPAIKSRAELQQARQRGRIPEPSYDFDGDGVIGQLDYFVGRCFDKDCDGRLTPGERKQAEQALDSGFLNKFVRGLDSTGDKMRPFALQQKRGCILSADNAADISNFTYPKHHNAQHVPKHDTKTALELSRLGERKGAGAAIGERYIAANCTVPEPVPPNHETHPRSCDVSHIRERAEADHQLSRVRGGLMAMNSYVNPERECRSIGLDYDPAPPMATRSQLLETRKEGMRRECEEQRTRCDNIQVPLSVRRTEKEVHELEFRRGGDHCKTLTKMKDQRRREKIEYDMENFRNKPKTYPKFSERPDIPFWVSDGEHGAHPAPVHAIPRMMSEPVFKISEMPFGDDMKESHQTLPDAAYNTAAGLPAKKDMTKTGKEQSKAAIGSRTKKRFCAEMIERGQARNMPRLFDAIQPLHTGPRDMESLDVTSSLAPIRENAMKKNAEQRKRNAEKPRVSMLWSDSSQGMQQQSSAASQAAVGGNESAMMGGNSLDGMGGSMSTNQQSKEGNRSSAALGGPARATRIHHVMSDPSLRASGPQAVVEPAREPKIFGTMPRAFSETGVRCGGFQRLDWPSHNARPGGPAPPAEKGGTKRGGDSRRNESRDHTRSKDTMHSTSTGTAQPL
jgi:hypothetical protein